MEPTGLFAGEGKSRYLSRGEFLVAGATGLAALLAGCGSSTTKTASTPAKGSGTKLAKGGTLNLWTWPQYWAPSNLSGFKAATGTTVNMATYQSDDEMYAKLRTAAGADYDIVIPDLGWLPVFRQSGVIQKLDKNRIAWQYIDKRFLNRPLSSPGSSEARMRASCVGCLSIEKPGGIAARLDNRRAYMP